MRRGQGRRKKNQAGLSQTSSLTSKRYRSDRKYELHIDGHKMVECILYYDQSDPRVAQRMRSKRQDERNSTSPQRRRQTSSNLVRVRKVMRVGHPQGGHVGGVRQKLCENHLVGSDLLCAGGHTHARATTFRISVGEAFRS